ncbi:unnamed protein product [Closterium sp. Naga37s-1]|nr:unnamed protein product [Closterium sp. Naga37s-1]
MAWMVDEVVMAAASLPIVMVTAVVTMFMTVPLSEGLSSMNNNMIQHAQSLNMSIRVLYTWAHMLYSVIAFVSSAPQPVPTSSSLSLLLPPV